MHTDTANRGNTARPGAPARSPRKVPAWLLLLPGLCLSLGTVLYVAATDPPLSELGAVLAAFFTGVLLEGVGLVIASQRLGGWKKALVMVLGLACAGAGLFCLVGLLDP